MACFYRKIKYYHFVWAYRAVSYILDICKKYLFLLPDWPKLCCKNIGHWSFALTMVLIRWMVLSKWLIFDFHRGYDILGKLKWLHVYWLESLSIEACFTFIGAWLEWGRQKPRCMPSLSLWSNVRRQKVLLKSMHPKRQESKSRVADSPAIRKHTKR